MTDTPPGDLHALYLQAFREFGSVALWNMRPVPDPTPAAALAITAALRTHGRMDGRRLAERIEALCRADQWLSVGRKETTVEKDGERMQLEWATDSAFLFPPQPDDLFGYVLHPVDLATNKAVAAADRRVPRDVVDLLTIHENILPLGAVVAAAVGRFPGTTPEEMLAEITRHSRFTAEEFQALATEQPIDVPGLHKRIRTMVEDTGAFIAGLPCSAVGVVFLDGGRPIQPDLARLASYERRVGSPGGVWPTAPDIARAMLERYGPSKP